VYDGAIMKSGGIMQPVEYEILEDGEGIYGEIPELAGVGSNEDTLEMCREGS
jgi:hypothetical protein